MDCTSESASILLFSRPVGRQEADNIDFLRRHGLIPSLTQEKVLWKMTNEKELLSKASNWRGLCLPYHSIHAADFIYWCLKTGIFKEMLNCRIKPRNEDEYKHELNPNGVKTFWQAVAKLL